MNEIRVNQQINDVKNDNLKKLEQLFPSAVKDGKVDFEALKEELGEFDEISAERYELNWDGKKSAKQIAQEDVLGKTLKLKIDEGVDSFNTENIYIKGDNLEILKLLRQNYYQSIKMIYIDPPYNTGNDFIYNDDFKESEEEYRVNVGDQNELGERYVVNSDAGGRYHSKWCSMIYPRIKIARDLLREDGLIFISIDDYEVENMKAICNEIFGKENAVTPFIWPLPRGINAGLIARAHEYILCYAKNLSQCGNFYRLTNEVEYSIERCNKKIDSRHPESTIDFPAGIPYEGKDQVLEGTIEGSEEVHIIGKMVFKNGVLAEPVTLSAGWTMKNMILDWLNGKKIYDLKGQEIEGFFFKENGKLYSKKVLSTFSIKSVLKDMPDTQIARKEVEELLGSQDIFPYPKTKELVKLLAKLSTKDDDIILDFFSGSATTAQAIMELNAADGNKRRYILAQLQEKCVEDSVAYKSGYKTICDIGIDRIKKASEKLSKTESKVDTGIKVFEVSDTNIKWNSLISKGQLNLKQIESTPDLMDFMPGTNDIDVVYEIMLRQRDVPLSEHIEKLSDIGERTYLFADAYLICLETEISKEMIDKMAAIDPVPVKYVFRDSAFKDDIALKDETFRRLKAVVEKNTNQTKQTYTVEFI